MRLRRKTEAEDLVTFWPVADLRAEVKRLQELYLSPTLSRQAEDSPKEGRSRSVMLQPRSLPRNKDETPTSAIPSDCLMSSPQSQDPGQVPPFVVPSAVPASDPEEAVLKEQAMAVSLQRAHHLSQCIGETVSALQETVAELRRSASGSFSVPEAFEQLQLDNQEMKQRLNRLEKQLERHQVATASASQSKDGSQRSSAAVPSEHSTVPSQVLSGRVVIPRIRYEAEHLQRVGIAPAARSLSTFGARLSGRATSPIPARPCSPTRFEPITRHSWHPGGAPASPMRRTIASYRVHLEAMPKHCAMRQTLAQMPSKVPLVQRPARVPFSAALVPPGRPQVADAPCVPGMARGR